MKIKVHRGTRQIGGSITEIYTEKTHIFIDFGSELNVDPEDSTDSEMIEMMKNARCDAVLFTHYHGDHIGLMKHIPEKDVDGKVIKLGFGIVARQVLINIHETLAGFKDAENEHRYYLSILQNEKRKIDIKDGVPFVIGDIKITPVRVDHSAYDAFLFIVEADGKTIVHTGDFRTHGRLGKDFFERLEEALTGKTVDVLVTEGTMLSRLKEKVLTEKQMQAKAKDILKRPENKYAFLICSSANLESLASFANAAMKLGRAFYVNYYVEKQIKLFRETAGVDNDDFKFKKTYKFESMTAYNPKLEMTQPEYMREHGFVMLIGTSDAYKKRMNYFMDQDPLLIYSMWDGYVKKGKDTYDEKLGALYHGWKKERRVDLHTSGHATVEDIRQMILTTKPQKHIITIHTEKPEVIEELDIGEYKKKVEKLDDNEIVEV